MTVLGRQRDDPELVDRDTPGDEDRPAPDSGLQEISVLTALKVQLIETAVGNIQFCSPRYIVL